MIHPSQHDIDQATHVRNEVAETLNNLAKDGFSAVALLAGIAECAADLVTCTVGVDQVPRWFAQQALTTRELLDTSGPAQGSC